MMPAREEYESEAQRLRSIESCLGEQGSVMLREGLVSLTCAIRTFQNRKSRKFLKNCFDRSER